MEGMTDIICVVLGAFISIITTISLGCIQEHKKEIHYAKILYFDLQSIKDYLGTGSGKVGEYPDIRYNDNWQGVISEIDFLTDAQINALHMLYDSIYNYNKVFNQTEDMKKRKEYRSNVEYHFSDIQIKNLLDVIQKKCKLFE